MRLNEIATGASDSDWLLPAAIKDKATIGRDWQPLNPRLIDGLCLKEVRPVLTSYGHLTEVFRTDWRLPNSTVDQIFASTLQPGSLSAWHAHAMTTDRLFVVAGSLHVVLFDARESSPTYGLLNEFRLGVQRPMLILIPPKVWHGVQNQSSTDAVLVNAVDQAYQYEGPDHWRIPPDSKAIPYTFC